MALDRDETSERVLDIAETLVNEGGASNLKARSIAEKAGIAVGSVYNLFGDLDKLHGAVNTRLLNRLAVAGMETMAELHQKGVTDTRLRLLALARTYLTFVQGQPQGWAALLAFSPRNLGGGEAETAYRNRLDGLLEIITAVLADDKALKLEPGEQRFIARALFSSVHGIVINESGRRRHGPGEGVWDLIDLLVTTFLRGMAHR